MPKDPRSLLFPSVFTEAAVAKSFAELFGVSIRYDHKRDRYLLWDTHYWEEDKTEQITRMVTNYAEMLCQEGEKNEDKALYNWGLKLQNRSKMQNILALSRAIPPIAISGNEFDINPFLFGCPNGIIDLTSGELRSGQPTEYISIQGTVPYDPKAICPLWHRFIDTVFEGDDELIHYVQRALGYSLTASMREQVFFICYGNGNNGKSVLFKTISKIMGEYAATSASSAFKKSIYNTQTNDIADLDRKRLVVNSESLQDMILDEERIKAITGGDRITARRLHENNFSFYPVCKIWFYTNDYPKTTDTSEGMTRRIRVIDFPHQFNPKERIPDYEKVLYDNEGPGILRWLVEGAMMWKEEGLQDMPKSILRAIEDYKTENNPLIEFIDEKCVKEEGEKIQSATLYHHYSQWASLHRTTPLTQTAFGLRMKELGYEKKRENDGNFYLNLRLSFI